MSQSKLFLKIRPQINYAVFTNKKEIWLGKIKAKTPLPIRASKFAFAYENMKTKKINPSIRELVSQIRGDSANHKQKTALLQLFKLRIKLLL